MVIGDYEQLVGWCSATVCTTTQLHELIVICDWIWLLCVAQLMTAFMLSPAEQCWPCCWFSTCHRLGFSCIHCGNQQTLFSETSRVCVPWRQQDLHAFLFWALESANLCDLDNGWYCLGDSLARAACCCGVAAAEVCTDRFASLF